MLSITFCFLYFLFKFRKYLFDFSPCSYQLALDLNAVSTLCFNLRILKSPSSLPIAASINEDFLVFSDVSISAHTFIFRLCMSFKLSSSSLISCFSSFLLRPTKPASTDLITTFKYSNLLCGSHSHGI